MGMMVMMTMMNVLAWVRDLISLVAGRSWGPGRGSRQRCS